MPKTGKTFNVFLCGTTAKSSYGSAQGGKEHDFPEGELVAWLADFAQKQGQQEFVDYVIYNGVGSGYEDEHKYPTALTDETRYNQAYGIGSGAGSDEIADAITTLVQGKFQSSRLPGALNKPYAANAFEPASDIALMKSEDEQVINIIEAWKKQEITQVNLIGWSRGGYNAIRIAHKLSKLNPPIPVNILTFDPVPGPGRRTEDACTLPPNVKNYVSLIALNEHTSGFPPVIPTIKSPATKIQIETYPGVHSSMVGGKPKAGLSDKDQQPLTDLGRQFALKKLKEWGVPVPDETVGQYDEAKNWRSVHQNRKKYKDLQGTTITGFRAESKPQQSEEGDLVHHRYVTYGHRAGQADWAYLNEVSGLQHNKANKDLDAIFEIDPDTCTLHRKYNDLIIAGKIDQYLEENYPENLQLNTYHVEKLSDLREYIENRNQLAGTESVLKDALEAVTRRTVHLIEASITASIEKSKEMKSVEEAGFEIMPDSLHTMLKKLDKSYLFLAAETGSGLYVASLGSLIESEDDLKQIFNVKNKEGKTPLMIATEHGHLDLVQILMNLNASVLAANHKDHHKTALDYAAQYGQQAIAEALLLKYPEELRDSAKIHAMVIAAQHNQDELVKQWIGGLEEKHLNNLEPAEIITLIIWSIQQRNEKALTLLANDSLVLEKLFEDPSLQFMPNINEVIIWAVTSNNTYIINKALKHWPRLFASDSLVEHPQIDVFLLAAMNNKRDDVLAAVIFAHPDLLKLPLNKEGQTLPELGFATFRNVLKRQDSHELLMKQIQLAKSSKDRTSSFNEKPKSEEVIPQSIAEPAKPAGSSKMSLFAGMVAAIAVGYFGLLAAVALPPVAALLPALVTTAVVSSVTFGVPIIAAVVGIIAMGAYLYFHPEAQAEVQHPKIIIPEKNIVAISPESSGELRKDSSATVAPVIHRHSWKREELPTVKVLNENTNEAEPPPSPPPSPKKLPEI